MPAGTLKDALTESAGLETGITYLEAAESRVTYAELEQRALRILGELQSRGLQPGAHVLLLLDGNPQLVDAFWACQLGGYVAVPIAVGGTDEHQLKTLNVLAQLDHPTLVTQGRNPERLWEYARRYERFDEFAATFKRELNLSQMAAAGPQGVPHDVQPDDVAYLQYSSGSTGVPKGVVLTHAGVLADIRAIIQRTDMTPADRHLSWVPLTHDLGMVMFHLLPLVLGVEQYLMPAQRFARRPLAWLQAASATGATILCSPNFGYDHYLKSLAKSPQEDLDLNRVRVIFNGGEPIARKVCDEFTSRLTGSGLPATAIRPAYGLAEACVAVTMTAPGTPVESVQIDRARLTIGEPVVMLGGHHALEVVCVGAPVENCEVIVADADDCALEDGQYGRVLIRGAIVSAGYHGDAVFRDADDWLDTGDLGFFVDGDLYVVGRAKDTIIVNGLNYHPNDLERICQEAVGLEVGRITVAGVRKDALSESVAAFVTHRQDMEAFRETAQAVRRAITERTQLEVPFVVPVRQMPKTTSGKIQRFKLARALEAGEFDAEIDALATLLSAGTMADGEASEDTALRLHGIFNAVLPDVQIDVHDNFLDLGVSSLSLAEISEAVDAEYPDVLALDDYLENQTIAEVAAVLQARLEAADQS